MTSETNRKSDVRETLRWLFQIQNHDVEIRKQRSKLEEFPKEFNRFKKGYIDFQSVISRKKEEGENEKKALRHLELELAVFEGELKKYKEQARDVKSNKEYQAINNEIAIASENVSVMEDRIIETIERMDSYENELHELREELKQKERKILSVKKHFQKSVMEIKDSLAKLVADKRSMEVHVAPSDLHLYKKIRDHRDGIAIVTIYKKVSCGGCHHELRPQQLIEIRKYDSMKTCENCGRILVDKETDITGGGE